MSSELPENLALGPIALIETEACGVRWWVVCERLDRGGVMHLRYCGQIVGKPGEPAEELWERAAALLTRPGE